MLGRQNLNSNLTQTLDQLPNERIAIAFSGGGDSTALVHLCRNLTPPPLILTVDHGLREGSADEALLARKFAENLGLESRVFKWRHNDPKTGLQEKARQARYGLMGQACRENNIQYLLTGHTRDDQAETLLMRYDKGTGWRGAAGMNRQTYAPVWPQLALVTVMRPLLGVNREALRAYNRDHKLSWSEDPSNENRKFERIRARQYLGRRPAISENLLRTASDLAKGRDQEDIRIKTEIQTKVDFDLAGRALVDGRLKAESWKRLLRAVSGTSGHIAMDSIAALKTAISEPQFKGRTLAGALIRREGQHIRIHADPGPYQGRSGVPALPDQQLAKGTAMIWGGRFLVQALHEDALIMSGYSASKHLDGAADQKHPGRFDYALPFAADIEKKKIKSALDQDQKNVSCRSIVASRLI